MIRVNELLCRLRHPLATKTEVDNLLWYQTTRPEFQVRVSRLERVIFDFMSDFRGKRESQKGHGFWGASATDFWPYDNRRWKLIGEAHDCAILIQLFRYFLERFGGLVDPHAEYSWLVRCLDGCWFPYDEFEFASPDLDYFLKERRRLIVEAQKHGVAVGPARLNLVERFVL